MNLDDFFVSYFVSEKNAVDRLKNIAIELPVTLNRFDKAIKYSIVLRESDCYDLEISLDSTNERFSSEDYVDGMNLLAEPFSDELIDEMEKYEVGFLRRLVMPYSPTILLEDNLEEIALIAEYYRKKDYVRVKFDFWQFLVEMYSSADIDIE